MSLQLTAPLTSFIDRIGPAKPSTSVRARIHSRVMASAPHDPVLVGPITEYLAVPGTTEGVLVDCTIGAAGHAASLLAASGPNVHLVGFDRDLDALELSRRRLAAYADRVHLVHAPFDHFTEHVTPFLSAYGPLLGVLWDLGVSSMQLDTPGRGFSFRSLGPLDMRMDQAGSTTAAQLINGATEQELAGWIREYGEERHAARIANAIVSHRPFTTTIAFADLVAQAVPGKARRADRAKGIHPATRTFQAIRIAVNGELDRFSASLPQALESLAYPGEANVSANADDPGCARGGRLAVLAYHSLEDRIAKRFFADAAAGCICPPDLPVCGCGRVSTVTSVGRKSTAPSKEEIAANPRARSARLRVVERLGVDGRPAEPR